MIINHIEKPYIIVCNDLPTVVLSNITLFFGSRFDNEFKNHTVKPKKNILNKFFIHQ